MPIVIEMLFSKDNLTILIDYTFVDLCRLIEESTLQQFFFSEIFDDDIIDFMHFRLHFISNVNCQIIFHHSVRRHKVGFKESVFKDWVWFDR
jgi:hypothetical protein